MTHYLLTWEFVHTHNGSTGRAGGTNRKGGGPPKPPIPPGGGARKGNPGMALNKVKFINSNARKGTASSVKAVGARKGSGLRVPGVKKVPSNISRAWSAIRKLPPGEKKGNLMGKLYETIGNHKGLTDKQKTSIMKHTIDKP